MIQLSRFREFQKINQILDSKQSEFIYIRGRRRIGKSWILSEINKVRPNTFLFTGDKDASGEKTIDIFINEWTLLTGELTLSDLKRDVITWHRIFREMQRYAENLKEKLTIIFDEIQWMAKAGSGFIGALKTAWVEWEKSKKINVIVCGSSNKFFSDHVGGEEKILRGLQTAATIWIHAPSFGQIRSQWLPKWNIQEAAIAYMMTGGIPYYMQRIDPDLGFIHGINTAFFKEKRNLLNEINEILSLDFNEAGVNSVIKVLVSLGQDGSSSKQIGLKTGLAKSTISRIIEKLLMYRIVYEKTPEFRRKAKNEDLPRYFMKDFFLNFYYQVLSPLQNQIEVNEKGLLFPHQVNLSEKGYYIPNFSGKAFELLTSTMIENCRREACLIKDKLHLEGLDFEVKHYWDKNVQLDLLVTDKSDRIVRVLECKWAEWDRNWITELKNKVLPSPEGVLRKDFIIGAFQPNAQMIRFAEEQGVELLWLGDLLEGKA